VLQVAGAPAPAQQPARPLAVSCSWATRAVGKAALIDAHDLAENERGAEEIRARLFGRHRRGAGTGSRT
jgi:hypothetical protein